MKEDIKILEEFINNNFQKDKLERNEKGGFKIGTIYKTTELNPALEKLIKGYGELEEENKQLKEYIFVAPNLDEMTAVKYSHIQSDAYFRGRAEEQQRAEEIIHNHYIPKTKIKENILNPMKEEHDKAIKSFMKRDIPQCIEDGGIAQVLGHFIGKIEELLEDK